MRNDFVVKRAASVADLWPSWALVALFLAAGLAMGLRALEGMAALSANEELSFHSILVVVLCPAVIAGALLGIVLVKVRMSGADARDFGTSSLASRRFIRLSVFFVPVVALLQVTSMAVRAGDLELTATLIFGGLLALAPTAVISLGALLLCTVPRTLPRAGRRFTQRVLSDHDDV